MALWLRDGFELYTTQNDMMLAGNSYGSWDSVQDTTQLLTTNTRFGVGQGFPMDGSGSVGTGQSKAVKAGFSNRTTVFVGVAIARAAALSGSTNGASISIRDGATAQVTINFRSDGAITLTSGTNAGTVLATYTGAFLANQWNQYQFKIVIDPSAGEFHVRKNGNTSDDFSATSLNTRGGTGTTQVNAFALGLSSTSQSMSFDDFAIWDDQGSSWNTWMGDFRIVEMPPISDNTVQFSQSNGGSTTFGTTTNTSSRSRAAGVILLFPFTPTCGGSLGSLTIELNANLTGHMKAALYDADGDNNNWSTLPVSLNQPGTLLYQTNEVTNPTSGTNAFTWTATPYVQNGHKYYLAIWNDAAATIKDNNSSTAGKWNYTLAYAGSWPTTLQNLGSTLSTQACTAYATITPLNAGMANDYLEDGATTYVFDSTVGHSDLYNLLGLTFTPTSVLGVDVVGMVSKSDAGARGVKLQLKSSGTTQLYTEIFPNTAFNFYKYQQDTDPATGLAWTSTALNNALLGQTITT